MTHRKKIPENKPVNSNLTPEHISRDEPSVGLGSAFVLLLVSRVYGDYGDDRNESQAELHLRNYMSTFTYLYREKNRRTVRVCVGNTANFRTGWARVTSPAFIAAARLCYTATALLPTRSRLSLFLSLCVPILCVLLCGERLFFSFSVDGRTVRDVCGLLGIFDGL